MFIQDSCVWGHGADVFSPTVPRELWAGAGPGGPQPHPRNCPSIPPRVPHRVLPSGPSSNPVKLFLLILGGVRGC